jgi:hypothetical protein
MIPTAYAGVAKAILTGAYYTYASARDTEKLALILERCYGAYEGYGFDGAYDGERITTVEKAIAYAKTKITARGSHQRGAATVSLAVTGASAAVGGLGGSIVPVAGTTAGAAAGAGIGAALGGAMVYGFRGLKKFKKYMSGTLGEHRKQAAKVLVVALTNGPQGNPHEKDFEAATLAQGVLLGPERVKFWLDGGPYCSGFDDEWESEIYAALASW